MKAGDLVKISKFNKPYVAVVLKKYEIEPYWMVHIAAKSDNHCLLVEPEEMELISENR